jgi:hypothetical protein
MTHVVSEACIKCKAPLPEAEEWKDKTGKLPYLIR